MTATALEDLVELEFTFDLHCEHSEHDTDPECHEGLAYVLVKGICLACNDSTILFLCKRFWDTVVSTDEFWVGCNCGYIMPARISYEFIAFVKNQR